MTHEHVDVLIVGAGISGIGAGYHLQAHCPNRSYAILEGRDDIGGTWDLFRFPGIKGTQGSGWGLFLKFPTRPPSPACRRRDSR